ncbi:MAG: 3-ketoacyl-ACP reductase [Spirochaetota bacterium]
MEAPLALVTGAGRGIGRGVADALSAAGFRVIRADISAPGGIKSGRDETPAGGTGFSGGLVTADISTSEGRGSIVEAVEAAGGALAVLVNNAGVSPIQRIDVTQATEESFDRVMTINARGPHFLTQALVPALRRGAEAASAAGGKPRLDHGTVVFVTSSNARAVSLDRSEYCMSKAALGMAAQIWAVRFAEWNIRVYDLLPGLIETEMTKPAKAKYDQMIESGGVLQRRWGTPEDIGKTVAALAQGALGYATGQALRLDGGMTIERF